MKSFQTFLAELKANDTILAGISAGGFKKDIMKLILKDIDKIFKKYTKDKDFAYQDAQFNDRGVIWNGEDTKAADKVITNIIGDIYDYFNNTAHKKKPMTKKSQEGGYTYYNVRGWDGKKYVPSQITFFRKDKIQKGDSVIGFLIDPK